MMMYLLDRCHDRCKVNLLWLERALCEYLRVRGSGPGYGEQWYHFHQKYNQLRRP